MKAWRRVRSLGVGVSASVLAWASGYASADYQNALDAYLAATGSDVRANAVVGAIDLWQKSALAGDVRSARILGDLYSDQDLLPGSADMLPSETGVVPYDLVQALSWYIIAATHNFADYQQRSPLPAELAARTVSHVPSVLPPSSNRKRHCSAFGSASKDDTASTTTFASFKQGKATTT